MSQRHPNVLVCGPRSFAARGLVERLQADGFVVTTFSRGTVGREGIHVTGPVDRLQENPHLAGPFDAVVNYILLKDESIERNNQYLEALLKLCETRGVTRLLHLSSMSVYSSDAARITEDAPIETQPQRKGAYGSLKVATDLYLLDRTPANLQLTMIRPGFILGPGVTDPMVGMGLRIGKNNVLLLGSVTNQLPLTTRELVTDAIARLLAMEELPSRDVVLLADSDSPTRQQWLSGCCRHLGCGQRVIRIPVPIWYLMGFGGAIVARLTGMKLQPAKIVRNFCRSQTYDADRSAKRLGMSFKLDWPRELVRSFAGQERNFVLPPPPDARESLPGSRITFIGFGQVVRQKHLPALRRLKFAGQIAAFDVVAGTDATGQSVQSLDGATLPKSDLIVVASPGPFHSQAIPLLRQQDTPALIEKPLCYRNDELDAWMDLANSRSSPISVCQNYRFKPHVERMLRHLTQYEPGKLLQVDLSFHSPSVANESRPWSRNERAARTLLMDYAIHFLDIACMFSTSGWSLQHARHELDGSGATGLIEGRFNSDAYPVNFILRQGLMPRRATLRFTFQNYLADLSFYPDTFIAQMAHDGPALYAMHRKAAFRATASKIWDKIRNRDSDPSHARAYLAAVKPVAPASSGIHVRSLYSFYKAVLELADAVYS